MLRPVLLSAALIAVLSISLPAQAADTCERATGRKCKVGESAPPKWNNGPVTRKATQAPPKGNHKGREEYTSAQRDKFMDAARALCRREYGAPSRVYRIDYKRNTVWCEAASY